MVSGRGGNLRGKNDILTSGWSGCRTQRVGWVALGGLIVLWVAFFSALVEKAVSLARHAESWHPVILANRFLRGRPRSAMVSSLVLDVLVLLGLVARPIVGGILAVVAILTYSIAGSRVHSFDSGCRCFWRILETTSRTGFLARNGLLLAMGLLVIADVPEQIGVLGIAWAVALFTLLIGVSRVKSRTQIEVAT